MICKNCEQLKAEIVALHAQQEQMKCCQNCRHAEIDEDFDSGLDYILCHSTPDICKYGNSGGTVDLWQRKEEK